MTQTPDNQCVTRKKVKIYLRISLLQHTCLALSLEIMFMQHKFTHNFKKKAFCHGKSCLLNHFPAYLESAKLHVVSAPICCVFKPCLFFSWFQFPVIITAFDKYTASIYPKYCGHIGLLFINTGHFNSSEAKTIPLSV